MTKEKVGFNIWTKNKPKDYIYTFAEHAKMHDQHLTAVVDDVLPHYVFDRTDEESAFYTSLYKATFIDAGYDEFITVSELFPGENGLKGIIDMSTKISTSEFLALLPEKKREVIDELTMTEVIDATWQLHVLDTSVAKLGLQKFLIGKRSTAMFRSAKRVIPGLEYEIID